MRQLEQSQTLKRMLDVTGALLGLSLLAPLLGLIAFLIFLSMGWPILFSQKRPGLDGHPFTLYKFRTMRPTRSGELWFRSDQDRLTRLGRLLRKFSLDELPELWNVVRGDMSLVGPRPLLVDYLPKYSLVQMRRHEVRPGITGWAQVNGRQNLLFSRRLELDVWYVDNWTNWIDFKILCCTAIQLFRLRGVISGQNVDDVDDLGLSSDRELNPNNDLEGS